MAPLLDKLLADLDERLRATGAAREERGEFLRSVPDILQSMECDICGLCYQAKDPAKRGDPADPWGSYPLEQAIREFHALREALLERLRSEGAVDADLEASIRKFIDQRVLRATALFTEKEGKIRAAQIAEGARHRQAHLEEKTRLHAEAVAAHDLLAAVVEQMPIGVSVGQWPSQKPVFQNEMARRLIGLKTASDEASQSELAPGAMHADGTRYRTEELPTYRALLEGESVRDEEIQCVGLDGQAVAISVSASPVRNAEGEIIASVSTFVDLTQRKATEYELAFERDKFAAIFRESPAAMALWRGPDLTFEIVNPQFQQMFLDRKFIGRTFSECFPDLEDQPFYGLLKRVYNTGEIYMSREMPALIASSAGGRRARRYFDFAFLRMSDPDNKPYGVYVHAVEATERVTARRRLLESEDRLKLALSGGKMGAWTLVLPQKSLVLDARAEELFGAQDGSALQDFFAKSLHPNDASSAPREIERAIQSGEPYVFEYRVRREDGSYRWVCGRGEAMYENNVPRSISGIAFDIDDQMRAQYELEAAKRGAERANQAKSAFLANMSHEIRTPLGAIMGFVSVLRGGGVGPRERDKYLAIVDRNSKHLLRIIDDILDLAKVEAGKLALESAAFSFIELLNDFTSLMALKASEKGIVLTASAETAIPDRLISDATRVRQILSNIVGNAIKFTSRGQVDLAVSFRGQTLRIRVADTGTGISKEQGAGLFQAFAQADVSTTRLFGGTGLGLVLTKKLCQSLGGDFALIESAPGKGSVFEAFLRADAARGAVMISAEEISNGPKTPAPIQGAPLDFRGLQVLLVEDSPDNQILVARMIRPTGAAVAIASDGAEGVEKALARAFDLILMDIQMPKMDGHEAVRALRAKGYAGPIAALTAHAMKEERDRAEASGFTDFLTKPVRPLELFAILKQVFQAKALAAGASASPQIT
jgi:PAS domain S-box-containing protein